METIKKMEQELIDLKKNYPIFDINVYIPSYRDEFLDDDIPTPEQILTEGVDKLVLADKHCMLGDIFEANDALFERVKGNDAFYASPIIVPEMHLGGRDFAAYLDYMIKNKAAILRAFPAYMKHSMKKWQMGDMFKAMEDRRIPLMVWHMETTFDTYADIAENYPNLPIIIEGSDQKTIYYVRDVMGLLERYDNIYLEMHNFSQYGFLPYCLENIGAERLLFGSFSPYNDMNGVLRMIDKHTTEEQKKLILSGSFERLLANIKR